MPGALAEQHARQFRHLADVVARRTGRPQEHVEAELASGRWLDSGAALTSSPT